MHLTSEQFSLLLLVLPGTTLTHAGLVAPLGVISVVYGLLSIFVLDWRTLPAWVLPTGTLGALVSTSLAVYATGGFDSPIEQVPVFVVVYSACFLSSRFTAVCAIGAVVGHELPLLYDAHARAQSVVADSLSAVLVYGSLAFVVLAGRVLLARLSEEHAVMRELATVVAAGTPQADVFVLASRRIASLPASTAAASSSSPAASRPWSGAPGPSVTRPRWRRGPSSRSRAATTCMSSTPRGARCASTATGTPSARRAWATAAR